MDKTEKNPDAAGAAQDTNEENGTENPREGVPSLGEAETTPVDTQQAEKTGEESKPGTPDAGESEKDGQARERAFRALMEGEYKDLFTAYFQETFNRRFREQKRMCEELERARAVVRAAVERFGEHGEETLARAIRESADGGAALEEAVRAAREETERRVLDSIRARGLRPAENGVSRETGAVSAASHLSRAQREELARRAAMGERIEF